MALESALWGRCVRATKVLREANHRVDLQRVENCAVSGHPDVEGCIDGNQVWIELKSCMRPARPDTPIRPKTRPSQNIWHRERSAAGSRQNWILIQVGEDHKASHYLIPGNRYEDITAPEVRLAEMSVVSPKTLIPNILLRACQGW